MEEDYNWNLILKAAGPIAVIEAYVFYTNISDGWKWLSLAAGLLLAFAVIYQKDKKKNNLFTAAGIVFLAALVARII